MMKVNEIAKELKVTERTIRRWIANGQLKYIRLPGGGIRIEEAEIEKLREASK